MSAVLPLQISAASPSALHGALSSRLHRLTSPCQLVASATEPLKKRKAALKELLHCLGNEATQRCLAAADALCAGHNGQERRHSPAASWAAVLDAVMRLTSSCDRDEKTPSTQAWDALRWTVEAAERSGGHHLVSPSVNLLPQLLRVVRSLLSPATDSAKRELCAPAATHVLVCLLSHAPYLQQLSASALSSVFSFYALAFRAILSSRDQQAYREFVTAESSGLLCSPCQPPVSLFRCASLVGQALRLMLSHWPHDVQHFMQRQVMPLLTTLSGLQARGAQGVELAASSLSPAFSHASFAELLTAFTSSLQHQHHLLLSAIVCQLPGLLSALLQAYPLSSAQTAATMHCKQAAVTLFAFAFALQSRCPHLPLLQTASHQLLPLIARVCLWELRRPTLLTLQWQEVRDGDDGDGGGGLDEATSSFLRLCVGVFHQLELRAQDKLNADQSHQQRQQQEADTRQRTLSLSSFPRSSSPADTEEADSIRSSKRRKEADAPHAAAELSDASPLPQLLLAFSYSACPPLSHFLFLCVFTSQPASASYLLSTPQRLSGLKDLLQHLMRWARRAKNLHTRLWSLHCVSAIAFTCQQRAAQSQPHHSALQEAWEAVCSVCLKRLLQDENRLIVRQTVSLLACLLHQQLLPSALHAALVPVLPDLPRLLTTSAIAAARSASSLKDAVKREVEDDAADPQSAAPSFLFPTPACDCDTVALRFITACCASRSLTSLLDSQETTEQQRLPAAAVSSAGANSLRGMLLHWVLRLSSAGTGKLSAAEWHSAAVVALLQLPLPSPLAAFLSRLSSWSDVRLLPSSSSASLALPPSTSAGLTPPSEPAASLTLSQLDYDSPADLLAFLQTAYLSRLLPLPSPPGLTEQPPEQQPVSAAADSLRAAFPQYAQLHALEAATRLVQAEAKGDKADGLQLLQHARGLLHHLHLLLSLPPMPHRPVQLLTSLLSRLASSLSATVLSSDSLPVLDSVLLSLHQLLLPPVSAFAFLSSPPEEMKDEEQDGHQQLVEALGGVSGALQSLLCRLLESGNESAAGSLPSASEHSGSLADGGVSALGDADDFMQCSSDDDGSVRDLPALLSSPLSSLPAFPSLLRRLHGLLLALLKLEVPLPAEAYAALMAMTEAEPASPFVFQLLLLLGLHNSLLRRDNLLLLRSTQRLSDAVNAEREAKDAVVANKKEERSRSARLRRGGSRAQAEDDDSSEEQQTADEAADALSPLSLQAVSFCLHVCELVQDGHVELGQEVASGAEMSEEAIMRSFIASAIACVFPSAVSHSSCPSWLSPLLRCLCCLRGLDSGLLSTWSLPTSLFPLLAFPSLSLSSAVIAASTLAAMMDRTTDAQRLWSSSSERLLQTVEDVRERQRKTYAEKEEGSEEAGRRCDELLYAVLGCLAAMAIRRLDWERRVLLLLCRLSAESGEEGQWPMRAVLQQMSEALGYTAATPCPQPFVTAAAASSTSFPFASSRPSLYTRPSLSLLEEHADYLLMHWLTAPGADLFAFPFALLPPPSPQLPLAAQPSFLPIAAPSLAFSLTRYMPQVLSACLLNLSSHEAALLTLPSHVNDTLPALLSRHWDALFSCCYALYSSSSPQAAAAAKLTVSFLKRQLGNRAFNALHHSRLPHLLAALLSLLSRQPGHPLLPVYDAESFTKSVIQLSATSAAELPASCSPADFLCQPGEDRLVLLLLHLRSSLYAEYRQERQWRWLQALRSLLSLLDCWLAKGYVARLLIDLLLAVLEEADGRLGGDKAEQVVDMLAHLLQRVLELAWRGGEEEAQAKGSSSVTDMAAEDIGRHLRFALLQLIRRAADSADRQRRLAAIVATVTARVPPHHALLQPLMLLSGHPCMSGVFPSVASASPSLQSLLASYLLCFDDLTVHCDTSCMIPLTAALLACLQQRREQLLAWLSAASAAVGTDAKAATMRSGRSETGRRRAVEEAEVSLPRFLAVLIRLCSASSPAALRELAAQCLGNVGLVDPQQIPQRHCALFQPAAIPQPAAAASSAVSSALPPAFSPTFSRWHQLGEGLGLGSARLVSAVAEPQLHLLRHYHQYLLYLLALALRSPSLLQQRLAFCTLTALFNSDTRSEAQQACHSLTADVQAALFPFSTRAEASKGSIASVPGSQLVMSLLRELKARPDEQQAVAAVVASLSPSSSGLDAELWTVRGKQAGQWLNRALYQLLRVQVSDGLLRLMKEQALFDSELALRLFPLAVMDCLSSGRTTQQSDLAAAMMTAMRDCLECCREEAELRRFLSPLLFALQYVREQLLILLRQPVPLLPRQPAEATVAAAAGGTAAAAASAPFAPVAALLPSNQPLKAALLSFLQELDLLLVAEAACALGWHSYALLWLESWRRQRDDVRDAAGEAAKDEASGLKRRLSALSPSLGLPQSASAPPARLSNSSRYHRLLLGVYRRLDDPDGLYGVLHNAPSTLSASLTTDVVLAEHGNDWPTALALHDMAASQPGITQALQQLQCFTLLAAYSHTTEAALVDEQQMEQAWRVGQWSMPATRVAASAGFNSAFYLALRSLHASGGIATATTSATLSAARQALLQQVEGFNSERVADVFPFLMRQVMLSEAASSSPSPLSSLLASSAVFDLIEPLLALRLRLQSLRHAPASELVSQLSSSASLARQASRPLITARHIRLAAELLDAVPVTEERELLETRLQVCHAQLSSAGGNVDSALRELQGCLSRLQRQRQELAAGGGGGGQQQQRGRDWLELDVLVNSLLGDWLSSSHRESAQSISQYLTRALSQAQMLVAAEASSSSTLFSSVSPACSVGSQHFALGNFHDRQFQSLLQRAQSSEYRERRAHFLGRSSSIAEDRQRLRTPEAEALLARKDIKDERFIDLKKLERLLAQREKEQEMDRRDFDLHDDAFTAHLQSAIAHYQQCLAAGTPQQQQQDTFALYRFCALWFNHDRYLPLSPAKTANLSRFSSIPSHQFIPLVYQLASRLMPVPAKSALPSSGLPSEEYLFRKHVAALLARMCCEHPHHCLYPLFALTAGGQVERVAGSFQSASEINSQRIQAASHLLAQLKAQPSVRELITAQERLIAAYVELGNRKYRKEDRSVALKDTQLDRLSKKELQLLAVPTLTLPVLPSACYPQSSLVSIVRFDSSCHFATSGINRPLVLQLLCSDGQRHRQLLKASDDLRQDAVMEQLFSLVNSLLHADARTRRRQMRMRTYKVVPLTPGVGLVEWVSNTRSLHDCIVHHSDGTHARYHLPPSPAVWPYLQCLNYMRDCTERAELLSRYQLVCSRFPPSLHCHLLEQFPSSSAWFVARLRYTRSLAVASIIGYAVGLGDRHIQNILIDSQTAELVHIDLGVAFDTGRLLKTPELVPFRLTRALVDGLGVAGVEGGYRRGCEDVLRLLRDNGAMVAVLLEVFVYDPLYKWTLSPSKVRQLRPDGAAPAAAAAAAGGGLREGAAAEAAAQHKEQKTTAGTVAVLPTQALESASSPLLSVGELSSAAAAISAVGSKVNSGAYRALSAVKHRLAGEDGSIGGSSRLSVEGQVAALIQQATSEEKLCLMYWGWSAWV